MRAILVDDELLPLNHLQKILTAEFPEIDLLGTFQNPLIAKDVILQEKPDLVFLDIEMPGISGLELGEIIQENLPNTEIIFVTAFAQYAIQAFELYAIDYIQKPISIDRLRTTIARLQARIKQAASEEKIEEGQKAGLTLFNAIQVKYHNDLAEPIKWRTKKVQQLFAYLVHHRGKFVSSDILVELLWEDLELDNANNQLYTGVYHVRKTLKEYRLDDIKITRSTSNSGYQLDLGETDLDIDFWENRINQAPELKADSVAYYEETLRLYQEDYLSQYEYPWAEQERKRLRLLFISLGQQLQDYYLMENDIDKAIQVNLNIQKYAGHEDMSYYNLMKIYASQGRSRAVTDQYQLLEQIMQDYWAAPVETRIKKWYQEYMREQKN